MILGDPLATNGAVFSLKMNSSSVYSASIDGQSEYSLISFLSSDGAYLDELNVINHYARLIANTP